jgi:hypothetical protein
LNPLKVLSEFITKWRSENTKREANKMKYENDRLRIQADLAARLIAAAPNMDLPESGTSRLIDMAEDVIKPTTSYLTRLSTDSRIIDAKIVRPGRALPPRKP